MAEQRFGEPMLAVLGGIRDPLVSRLRSHAAIAMELFETPRRLRRALAIYPDAYGTAVLAGAATMDPLNVASALVRDNPSRHVLVVADDADEGFLERAAQAGVGRVLTEAELIAYLRDGEGIERDAIAADATETAHAAKAADTSLAADAIEAAHAAEAFEVAKATEAANAAATIEDIETAEVAETADRAEIAQTAETAEAIEAAQAAEADDAIEAARDAEVAGGALAPQGESQVKLSLLDSDAIAGICEGLDEPDFGDGSEMAAKPQERLGQSDERPRGVIVALVSGRGGVGKSALACTMAAIASGWGLDVALLDYDLAFGNLFGYLGQEGPADLTPLGDGDALSLVASIGRKVQEGLTLFGPCAIPEYSEVVMPKTHELLEALATCHDLVVVDGGTTWNDGTAQVVQAADRVVICADERAGAIGSMARAADLVARLGVARTRLCRLVNRCDPRHRDSGFLARADVDLETAQSLRVLEGGVEVAELMSAGSALEAAALDNPFTRSVGSGLARLLEELGRLPEGTDARRSLERGERRRRRLFWRAAS